MKAATAFCIALCAFGLAGAPAAQNTPLESRLESLETLVERSSAARQIEASAAPEAMALRARAREALKAAREAQRSGDAPAAERHLADARRFMIEGARLAAPESRAAEKAQGDFERRLESTRALLGAQKRVSAEKSSAGGAEAARTVEQRLEAALRLRADGRVPAALEQLEQAYLIAKASLSSMRAGDTLVRSLSFATKEEEYRYEVDRNDTHQMLVRVLLQGRQPAAGEAAVAALVERARGLRARAEEAARRGEHAAAVQLLEDSTGELVKAIRGAGVYIPG